MMGFLNLVTSKLIKQATFSKYEKRVIDEVALHLPDEAQKRLSNQINQINKIQRFSDGKEVNLYPIRYGRPAFDESLSFPDKRSGALLASVKLVHPAKTSKLKAEVWLASGHIFSIVFDKSPQKFFTDLDLNAMDAEIVDVRVWFNPMQPWHTSEPLEDTKTLSGWLSVLNQHERIKDTQRPLSEESRNVLIETIDSQLPADYLDAIKQTEGFTVDNCRVFGISEIRKVTLPAQDYYIIAEVERKAGFVLTVGERSSELSWLEYEDDRPQPQPRKLGCSLSEYLIEQCGPGTNKGE
ncbi:MAG: hypothetical protein HQK59_03960 [Deltaproteobacteria bacterium]|nr:hypothetical protein [Deltaproteobacteria bacterium]